jgi:hypothetical protein
MNEERNDLIKLYFDLGIHYKHICSLLKNEHGIQLSYRHLKRVIKSLGLHRKNFFPEIDTVVEFISKQLHGSGSLHGYRWMYEKCLLSGIKVRKEDVRHILQIMDPEGVEQRRAKRLHRRSYFTKGPNYIWHIDSYDKLKPYGICINGCIDGYSRKMIWLNAYKTSSDPKVIGGYYIQSIEGYGCPRIIRGDKGTENSDVCKFQRHLRHHNQDAFAGEKSFMYGRSVHNQRIERWWGFLRQECVHFWMELFYQLKDEGNFDGYFLDKNLVLFCFLAIIQDELDAVVEVWDSHLIRPSRNDRVAHGKPNVMYYVPQLYGSTDYVCTVSQEEIAVCRERCTMRSCVPCDEDVYEFCLIIMGEYNLKIPKDATEAVDLYLQLRAIMNEDLGMVQ